MLARISAAKVSRISSGALVHSFMIWRGARAATAVTDCVVLRIGMHGFHEILGRNFGAVLAVIRVLSERIRAKEAEVLEARKKAAGPAEE